MISYSYRQSESIKRTPMSSLVYLDEAKAKGELCELLYGSEKETLNIYKEVNRISKAHRNEGNRGAHKTQAGHYILSAAKIL